MSRKEMKRVISTTGMIFILSVVFFTGCTKASDAETQQQEQTKEADTQEQAVTNQEDTNEENSVSEESAPNKETVLKMREIALSGMTDEQIESMTERVKSANLSLENGIMFDNLIEQLSDSDSLMWNYLEQTGEIQIGWAFDTEISLEESGLTKDEYMQKYATTVSTNNEYDADSYIALIDEILEYISNEDLKADFTSMRESVKQAKETHDVNEVINIYHILHDMDYYLLRYGPEDVGQYVSDTSTINKYYGVLKIYENN
ncbi:hypothetical protein [Lachnotalea glycerini]|uniref:Uncharacterized protein n=1 Tax=Lachnotalea glycerini TaxID=1763509 RepID=A0A371J6I0_9FIRM|nr:hypothetical protein [Lachnotalea glycerini]RDY28293.1 hypothetical protein CG710_019790 [Lachnotalea glycerini]